MRLVAGVQSCHGPDDPCDLTHRRSGRLPNSVKRLARASGFTRASRKRALVRCRRSASHRRPLSVASTRRGNAGVGVAGWGSCSLVDVRMQQALSLILNPAHCAHATGVRVSGRSVTTQRH